jgi:hypothetical protein
MMTFKTEEDLRREKKAIDLFVKTFGGTYQKLDSSDVNFKVFDKNKNLIAYAEVVSRVRIMRDAYPLPVQARKVVKLTEKRIAPVVIWSCDDGIIYGTVNRMIGEIKWVKSPPDGEMMVYYEKQRALKYVRFS